MSAEMSLPTRPPPHGEVGPERREGSTERRLVSVLFADLVGSTAFAEGRDPEDVRALLGEYFATASEAIERHGGVVEKFIGDAVMAVWGTPVAHEDDAERAVRSALDIVDRVAALGAHMGVTLQARVGVLTGEAVAAVGAVGQGLVAGDLVNTASRLQSAADPGTVLVGERTYRAASEAIAFAPIEALTLKGKQDKVPAWRALRVISEVGGSGRGSAPEPPFVGRDEELRLAKELLHATGRESRPRLLSVTGVAGIGKSRLLWELRKYIDGITESVYWHQGRCPAYGEGVTFWAFAEMVRGRAGIAETDDDATARQRLGDCLDDLVADDDERRWMEPRLGHLLGLDPAPPGGRDELFGAWRRFIERVADRGTTVLVFEDLHWADPGLLDFVESLLAWSRSAPILVITLARPELAERRPSWGAAVRASSGQHLDPLPHRDISALVTGYVEGLPDGDLERLVSRAEGIPLYAVETVRMLADRGILEQSGSSYLVVSDLGLILDVPETLHALVAARLDGLPEVERSLVLDAAVTGHSFTLDAVCAVSGRSAEEVEPRLRALVGKEVLDQEVDPRSAERGQFHFVQSVIQEVAYSTLSKAARRSKHLACAQWFAGLGEDELAGIVASHFLEAYRAEPSAADAEQIAGQAREWLHRAATRAFSLGSPEAAYTHAIQALSLAATPEERAALHATAATGAGLTGRLDLAWEHYAAASDGYQLLGDAQAEGRMLATAARYGFEGDVRTEVVRRLEDVDRRLEEPGSEKVLVLAALADSASAEGHREDALRWSELALVLAQTLRDDEALSAAASARSWAFFNADRHFEAVLLSEGVMSMARRSGSAERQMTAALRHGVVLATGDPRGAMESFLDSAAIAGRAGIRSAQAMGLANAAESAIDVGELEVAARALAEVEEIGPMGSTESDAAALSKALLAAYLGDAVMAHDDLDRLELERRPDWAFVLMTTWFLRTRSAVRLVEEDPAGALTDAWESINLEASGGNASSALWTGVQAAARLRDPGAIASLLDATTGLRGAWVDAVRATATAALTSLRGDVQEGHAALRVALDTWRELNLPLDHALAAATARHLLPTELIPHEDVDSARDYLRGLSADGLLRLL
jgi:class 3 adenylate cyclase